MLLKVGTQVSNALKITLTKFHQHLSCGSQVFKGWHNKQQTTTHYTIKGVGNILEEIIDKRMETLIKFTQGQGGGVPGASTCDHLFLVRAAMQIAVATKQTLFLTFFDVKKAFDKADVNNMLHIAWKSGVRGRFLGFSHWENYWDIT